MYFNLLNQVVKVIDKTHDAVSPKEDTYSEFYNQLFAPELAEKQRQEADKRRRTRDAVIAGVTGIAVIGEIYHLARRSGVTKILKR